MIKNWYFCSEMIFFLYKQQIAWKIQRFQKVLLKNDVNNRTLPLTVVDPNNGLPDKFKDVRQESPLRCDKMLSLNILLERRSRFSSFPKCDDMISKPARELFLRVSHNYELTICIIYIYKLKIIRIDEILLFNWYMILKLYIKRMIHERIFNYKIGCVHFKD
jgi:hypothetical protein